jgi:hypothetical protein
MVPETPVQTMYGVLQPWDASAACVRVKTSREMLRERLMLPIQSIHMPESSPV